MKINIQYQWPLIFLFLLLFFIFFALFVENKPIENKVRLDLELNPGIIKIDEKKKEHEIAIKLKAVNPTQSVFTPDVYFFRVVINRSYPDSPGYIIKEFSTKLGAASDEFEENFLWEENILNNEEFKFRIHFNMYRRNGNKEPTLIASSTKILRLEK